MISNEKLVEMVMENRTDVVKVGDRASSAHKRIDEISEVVVGIHSVNANINNLTKEMGRVLKTIERNSEQNESRLRPLEIVAIEIPNMNAKINDAIARCDEIDKRLTEQNLAPLRKMDKLLWSILGVVIIALISYFFDRYILVR